MNDKVKSNLETLDEAASSQDGSPSTAAGGAALHHQQLGASLAADAALQRQLQAHTPEALAAAALKEACSIIAACQEKLAESAAATPEAGAAAATAAMPTAAPEAVAGAVAGAADAVAALQQAQREPGADGSPAASTPALTPPNGSAEGHRLNDTIQGCVHTLVLLQKGAAQGSGPPLPTLSAALDAALAAVAPRSAANRGLYEDIQVAVAGLKQQIGAAAS